MQTTVEATQALKNSGFKFPHESGLFRHPLLNGEGNTVDPLALGFNIIGTGGGCEALELAVGEFLIWITADDGCSTPAEAEWADSLIGIYRAEDREEVAMLTGLQWLEMVGSLVSSIPTDQDFDNKNLSELSAWYVDRVGYDPLKDDPDLDPDTFRSDCKEYALIERCGGLDSDAYRMIEASRQSSVDQ
ncbi:hypothetical protein [Pseudomonas aeruginosa]|uniref:hypothetical protein n=1 Tax=Pseudomonas aeruginosa TaxID=287 RepID=UPI003D2AED20